MSGPGPSGISIGLPIHNGERYLEEALDALEAQTFREFQVIAVDDGSTDGSREIIQRRAARDGRIHLVSNPARRGLVGAWRQCAELARDLHHPEFFAWYADHDRVAPDWIERLHRALRDDPSLVCAWARTDQISPEGELVKRMEDGFDSSRLHLWKRIEAATTGRLMAGDVVYGLFRFQAMERCGIFREELMPDRLLVSEVQLFGGIRLVPDAVRQRRMTAPTGTIQGTVERQLRTLFPQGIAKRHPVISHLTCFLRLSMDPLLASDPDLQFRRMLHAWLYLAANARKFRSLTLEEARTQGPLEGRDYLRDFLLSHKGFPGVLNTENVEELRWRLRSEAAEGQEGRQEEAGGETAGALRPSEVPRKDEEDLRADIEELRSWNIILSENYRNLQEKHRWSRHLGIFGLAARGVSVAIRARRDRKSRPCRMPFPRILHVVPKTILEGRLLYHGSTKDIRGRTEYFRDRGIEVRELLVDRKEKEVFRALLAEDVQSFGCILFDMPGSYPAVLRSLRERSPGTFLLFRAHNAEFLHRMDWCLAARGLLVKAKYIRWAFATAIKDLKTVLYADGILSISDWDLRTYWGRLGPRDRVACVPYFLPSSYREEAKPGVKEDLCVCVGSASGGPLTFDAIGKFCALVQRLGDRAPGWRFILTGDVPPDQALTRRVELAGFLQSPFEILRKARAVAVLSSYGRGFKTKILEAIECGAWVLVPPTLHRRLPPELRAFCIPVGTRAEDLERALELCRAPLPPAGANDLLRDRAYRTLDQVLGIGISPGGPSRG